MTTRASVGGAEAREATEGGDGRGIGHGARGLMTAERSVSRADEDVGGTTRVRPSKLIVWSLCLFQHGWQMRLLMETSNCALSCRVKLSAVGSGWLLLPHRSLRSAHPSTGQCSLAPGIQGKRSAAPSGPSSKMAGEVEGG